MNVKNFDAFFMELCGGQIKPYTWQQDLAEPAMCGNRLIRIPTGFGKTMGVFATWAWHRVHRHDESWPRRLVWCLPMRTLVEQTETVIRKALDGVGCLWDGESSHDKKIGVHKLMGGATKDRYYLYPEVDSVLIGTQDMLLSRSMNRGYASPRARWPMEFGLLNQDVLWIMDEVQLMDVGLATSVQLQTFRNSDMQKSKPQRPCFTWWMSATLQRNWFDVSPDAADLIDEIHNNYFSIKSKDRVGHLWTDVKKHLEIQKFAKPKDLADSVSVYHEEAGFGRDGPTLVVLNTVKRATEVYRALISNTLLKENNTTIRLIHSQFRPAERKLWKDFLRSDMKNDNYIIVSTQVIEAGVDISVPLLISELAPWPSLVQRLGRCVRRGGSGKAVIADFGYDDDKKSAPYEVNDLRAALNACSKLPNDAAPLCLEKLEDEHSSLLQDLYKRKLGNILLRNELDDLFDTSPDLSGADIDISRFIRSGDERDVHVFWDIWEDDPTSDIKPDHSELCNIQFLKVRDWLCKPNKDILKSGVQAYIWSWLDKKWNSATRKNIYPGQTILVHGNVGGYENSTGWNPDSKNPVEPVRSRKTKNVIKRDCWKYSGGRYVQSSKTVAAFTTEDDADAAEEGDAGSVSGWQTIATHCLEVSKEIESITSSLKMSPVESNILCIAGRWHDIGKSHAAFQNSMNDEDRPERCDLAKGPKRAWPCSTYSMYYVNPTDHRRGFRHELAGAMALFSILRRHSPNHDALLGPWSEWLDALGAEVPDGPDRPIDEPTVPEQEVIDLNAADFDLLTYLVCSHHGKVRMTLHASPLDYKTNNVIPSIRGIREYDVLPSLNIPAADGRSYLVPDITLTLSPSETGLHPITGRSWTERVLNLVNQKGPFTLAWLEAIMRAADMRASKKITADKILAEDVANKADTHAPIIPSDEYIPEPEALK